MRHFAAAEIDAALDFPSLIDALAEAFRGGFHAPARSHHAIERPGEAAATMLLMPAWTRLGGARRFPRGKNRQRLSRQWRARPACGAGLYALQSGVTGAPLATLDGTRLTLWRTAAASALAARYLAPPDAKRLLIVGAGALAPYPCARPREPAADRAHRGVEPSPRGRSPARRRARRRGRRAKAVEHLRTRSAKPTSSPAPRCRRRR